MKVRLKQDQFYVSEANGNRFGKKDEVVNIDPLFHKLIADVCVPVKLDEKEDKKSEEKPLEKMNKNELIAKAADLELGLTQEQIDAMNKADIIKLIIAAQRG